MPSETRSGNWSPRTPGSIVLFVAAIAALALLSWKLAPVLLLVFGGILTAILFHALATWVSRCTKFSDGWSLAVVLAGLTALAAGSFYFGGQAIATQMTELADQIPQAVEKILEQVSQHKWGEWLVQKAPSSSEEMPISGKDMTTYISGALSSLSGAVATAFIVLFVAIYLAADPLTYVDGAVRLFPQAKRERVKEVLKEAHETLQWWLLGKIAAMFLVGVTTSVGLAWIGVPLAMALGAVAALLTFVPNFGPILSAVPAVMLAFVDSPAMALYVVILYVAIQTVESYLITPLIQQETVSLPPALTISTQIGMGLLFGAAGVVLATPFTAVAMVLVKRLYIQDILESDVNSVNGE